MFVMYKYKYEMWVKRFGWLKLKCKNKNIEESSSGGIFCILMDWIMKNKEFSVFIRGFCWYD